MSFDTYANLVDEISSALARGSEADARIPSWLRLAELQAQLDLRLPFTEGETTGAMVPSQDYIDLEATCVRVRWLRLDTSPARYIEIVDPQVFSFHREYTTGGVPVAGLYLGERLMLAPTPTSAISYTLWRELGIPALSATNTTNWLLTNCPAVLLYGTLMQAALGWLGNDERAVGWGRLYAAAVDAAKKRAWSMRASGGRLVTRAETWA